MCTYTIQVSLSCIILNMYEPSTCHKRIYRRLMGRYDALCCQLCQLQLNNCWVPFQNTDSPPGVWLGDNDRSYAGVVCEAPDG